MTLRHRNDGKGFVPLTYDTTPNYEDTAPHPATPTKSANGAPKSPSSSAAKSLILAVPASTGRDSRPTI